MKLIVGLGNPGEKYRLNHHNTGFLIIDEIAKKQNVVMRLENEFKVEKGDFNAENDRVMLVKLQTFMNNSGEAVSKLRSYYKLDTEDILVISDDIDLDFGKIRVALGGSSAGHKGVQSIIDQLGTDQFWRVRVGVGRNEQIPTEDWVLMNFSKQDDIEKMIDNVSTFVIQSDFKLHAETVEFLL